MAGVFFVRLPGLDEGFDFNEQTFGAKKQIHRSLMLYDALAQSRAERLSPPLCELALAVVAGAVFLLSPRNAHLSSTLVVIRGYGAGGFDMSWLSKLCFAVAVLACAVTWVGDSAISVSLRQEQQTECGDEALIVVGDVASHLGSLNDAQERLNLRTLSWQSCI